MVSNQFDAEDIVQDTVVKALLHCGEFRGHSAFKTWLMSIALNEVRTRWRRQMRSRISYCDLSRLESVASASPSESPSRHFQKNETARLVRQAAQALHPTSKELIRLRVFDELELVDAAKHLSISLSAAKARYFRAVHSLSRIVARRSRVRLQRSFNLVGET
jgi:RNA polymerase sigma-70 factor, ECF subfamily